MDRVDFACKAHNPCFGLWVVISERAIVRSMISFLVSIETSEGVEADRITIDSHDRHI